MDRLRVRLAVSNGRRLFHGVPFVVFAVDLRDALGEAVAELLHDDGHGRGVQDERQRADRRDRAPIVVLPVPYDDARELVCTLERTFSHWIRQGITPGDVLAVRRFVESVRWPGAGVYIFLATDNERAMYVLPHGTREPTEVDFDDTLAGVFTANTAVLSPMPHAELELSGFDLGDDPLVVSEADHIEGPTHPHPS
jgi:hypothetical protein